MFDIFRRELRGGVGWMGTARDEEAAREIVRKVHAAYPGVYFTFDHSTRTRNTIKAKELDETKLGT